MVPHSPLAEHPERSEGHEGGERGVINELSVATFGRGSKMPDDFLGGGGDNLRIKLSWILTIS